MATVRPIPSTPSCSSQSSLPPSYAISVHDHVLPIGWQCKYDPKTNKYYFFNDYGSATWDSWRGGQQGSCQSSRSSSPSHTYTIRSYYQPFSARYKANDATVQRIAKLFPDVDENYIAQLLRKNANREYVVSNILRTENYAKTYQAQPDEALYYKLKGKFPAVDQNVIKQLLCKYNNSEHDVISGIISHLAPHVGRYQSSGSPKMKLRYIKILYPEVDEIVLFDLLYNCDHNVTDVMEKIEKMGYKKNPLPPRPKNINADRSRPKTLTTREPKQPAFPPNIFEKQQIFEKLQADFPNVDRFLINMALESSAFNEERSRLFLNSMTPQDSDKYLPKDWSTGQSDEMTLQTKSTQTGGLIESTFGTPITKRKTDPIKTLNVMTCTAEDGIIIEKKKVPLAKGVDASNHKGTNIYNLIKSYIPWRGADSRNKLGQDPSNRKGPSISNKSNSGHKAKGPDSINQKGPSPSLRLKKPLVVDK
ncbi:uncharacterized protein LOC128390968 [Panonychus citri]|uniref:uncharacterized protein LOC128390968 n=1 Tax=Panonychus citri TaxID=50023 RepID=UPI002307F604|nr:uncharacterized protein LOC128390968 [Panonychus citri]